MAIEQMLGQYYATKSPLHRLDARTKLTLLMVIIVGAFFATTFSDLLIIQVLLIIVAIISRIPPLAQLKAAAPLAVLSLFPLVLNLLFIADGTALVQAGPILITDEGTRLGLFYGWRLIMMLYFAVLLVLSTTSVAICSAVASMLAPFERFGLPAYEIALMATIAMRFVPTLLGDFQHIRNAQIARGSQTAPGGIPARIKSNINLLVPLFMLAISHASNLADAMESRCYRGGVERGSYRLHHFGARELTAIFLVVAQLICVIVL